MCRHRPRWALGLVLVTLCSCLLQSTMGVAAAGAAHFASSGGVISRVLFEDARQDPETTCAPWAVPAERQCQYVREHRTVCGDDKGIIDYLWLHYCWLQGWPVLSNALLLSWIFVLSVLLTIVADRFFCPALEVVADYFRLPANVAGATLLSFGNGAPDVFTQLAAVSTMDASSVSIAIGEPIGGGMFVSNVVLAAVVLASAGGRVTVERAAFLRDAWFYSGAVLVLGCVAWDGVVTMVEACVMLAYYTVFVVYIVVHERVKAAAMHIEESRHYQEAYRLARALAAADSTAEVADTVRALEALPPTARTQALLDEAPHTLAEASSTSNGLKSHARALVRSITLDPRLVRHAPPPSSSGGDAAEPLLAASEGGTPVAGLSRAASAALEPAAASWTALARAPFVALLRLTMPEVGLADTVSYPKPFAVLLPITAPLFVVLAKGLALRSASPLNADALLYGLLCSAFSSAVVYSIYPSHGRHYGILSGLFTAMTFGMSVLWMDVAAGEMVRAWKCLGFVHGLSQAMLGVTVLAWTNSFGDAVANVAMARDGFPSMAIAACFASPFLTMIAGLGLSFFVAVIVHGDLRFEVEVPLKVAWGFLAASMARYVALVPTLFGWQFGRRAAFGMIAFYLFFQAAYLTAISRETGA